MAALSADVAPFPPIDEKVPLILADIKGAADDYFLGAVLCVTAATGVLDATPADADRYVGICFEKKLAAASNDPIRLAVYGRFHITAVACADASVGLTVHPLVASDNPADITATATGNPSAMGLLDHVTVTGTSGWIHTGFRSAPTNA